MTSIGQKPSRILVTGDSGRGKTTLAEKLSAKLGIPHYSTDDFFYEVKFSKRRDRAEALALIKDVYKKERWIVDGSTKDFLEPGLEGADLILWLVHKNFFVQWWIIFWRGTRRKHETIWGTLDLMRHVFMKRFKLGYARGKITMKEFLEPYRDKVVVLKSFREVNKFLNNGLK